MKKPDGTIDLIGGSIQLGLGVVDLIKEFSPSPEQRKFNKRQRRIRVAIRQLKHRFKDSNVEGYVKVNFSDFEEVDFANTLAFIQEQVGRK